MRWSSNLNVIKHTMFIEVINMVAKNIQGGWRGGHLSCQPTNCSNDILMLLSNRLYTSRLSL